MSVKDDLPVTIYFYPLLDKEKIKNKESPIYLQSLEISAENESILYIHIPYCISHCLFCPFNTKVISLSQNIANYIDALVKEAEMIAPYVRRVNFRAVYYGGGSPSIISGSDFYYLHNKLKEIFGFADDAEISVEGELRTLASNERLNVYRQIGVKRISFGLQTFDNKLRKLFNMKYDTEEAISMIKKVAKWKFNELNADMMYGLPNQDAEHLLVDIQKLNQIPVDSIDYYRLHPYALPKQYKGIWIQKANKLKPQFIKTIIRELEKVGFKNVCDQVYSKVGLSQYERLLWGNVTSDIPAYMVGKGASARGYLGGKSYMNIATTDEYIKQVSLGILPIDKISSRVNETERKRVFSPKYFEIRKNIIEDSEDTIKNNILVWEKRGWLIEKAENYDITNRGKVFVDEMIIDLMSYRQNKTAVGLDEEISTIDNLRTGRF